MTTDVPTLVLREWRDEDLEPFARDERRPACDAITFHRLLTRDESDALVQRIRRSFMEHGFGCWALGVPDELPFAGFVGLSVSSFELPFRATTPCVESAGVSPPTRGARLCHRGGARGRDVRAPRAPVPRNRRVHVRRQRALTPRDRAPWHDAQSGGGVRPPAGAGRASGAKARGLSRARNQLRFGLALPAEVRTNTRARAGSPFDSTVTMAARRAAPPTCRAERAGAARRRGSRSGRRASPRPRRCRRLRRRRRRRRRGRRRSSSTRSRRPAGRTRARAA